jgi:hypothetical protein
VAGKIYHSIAAPLTKNSAPSEIRINPKMKNKIKELTGSIIAIKITKELEKQGG